MKINKITRLYSRSVEYKRPDGLGMWIKHEESMEVELDEDDTLEVVDKGLEEILRKSVGASINAEKKLIMASYGDTTSDEKRGVSTMPKL